MGRLTWPQRRERLRQLLDIPPDQDVDEDGEAWLLDDLLWGSARPNNAAEYNKLCFGERDLESLGTIARGQFGLVEAVRCKIDERLYATKSIDRKAALRSREQCHPQVERDILLLARQLQSEWVPHLLSAFQTPDKLVFVMSYYDGGSLWDIVEALGEGTPMPESDLAWWMPQAVCAIEWCHSHGLAHRDIKPHNFVFDSSKRLRLVDFGSAAKMLPAGREGIQLVPKRQCIVPCGTCDYIAPEILNAHEEALIEIETETQEDTKTYDPSVGGYGKEIDWWSFGAMLYELAFGFPPFYAKDIRKTYTRIVDHKNNLTFPTPSPVSPACTDLMKRLLCHYEQRLGRRKSQPVRSHEFFKKVRWTTLHRERAPQSLQLPQFSAIPPPPPPFSPDHTFSDNDSTREAPTTRPEQPFDFSALFQSTMMSATMGVGGRGKSLNSSSVHPELLQQQRPPSTASTAFIGFSWGPSIEAFTQRAPAGPATPAFINTEATPRPSRRVVVPHTDPPHASAAFFTPMRGNNATPAVINTIPRSALRRGMSDREALRQLVGCVTVSARKRVLQTGRTPRLQVLRGVAFRNSDDGSTKGDMRRGDDAGTETEDEHLLPPSPSPSPRPSSRLSGRMGMLSDSTGSGGLGRRGRSGSILTGDSSSSGVGLRGPSPSLTNATAALEQTATMTMTGSVIEPPTREQSVFLPDASPPRRVAQPRAPQQPLPRSAPQPQPQPPPRTAPPSRPAPAPQPQPQPKPKPRHQSPQRINELDEREAELNRRIAGMAERHAALLGQISDLEQRLRQATTVTGE